MYTNFEAGTFIHCSTKDQLSYVSEYDKCETKTTADLEYYKCIYKIYKIPTEQVALLSKLHHALLKCKDCEYTRNWKFKDPKFCTNKAEVEYYKTYTDCLLNYINVNEEETEKREGCNRSCYGSIGILGYSKCAYDCYSDISKKIIEFEPKVTTFVNNTQINGNNTEGDKKSSTIPNFDPLTRDYDLACMYTNFEAGSFIHCNIRDQYSYDSEYDKCETKPTPDLEYYKCIYKIYQIPTEQVAFLSKFHLVLLKCKDCEYTRNWKFKDPKFCTNKSEVEYYKTYSDCLLNYINVNEEETEKRQKCTRGCYRSIEILDFSKCAYNCYSDISKKIIEFEPKVTTFVNNTQINGNNTEGDKKSSALPNFDPLNIYSIITLTLLTILTVI